MKILFYYIYIFFLSFVFVLLEMYVLLDNKYPYIVFDNIDWVVSYSKSSMIFISNCANSIIWGFIVFIFYVFLLKISKVLKRRFLK